MNIHVNAGNVGARSTNARSTNTRSAKAKSADARPASPRALIQLKYDEANRDPERAIALVETAAETNKSLRDYMIHVAAVTLIGELIRSDNAKIWRDDPNASVVPPGTRRSIQPEAPLVNPKHRARLIGAAQGTLRLLTLVLPNRKLLADARHADLKDAIDVYEPQAKDMLHKAEFFRRILRDLPKGKKVGEVMTNEKLTVIYRQAVSA